MYSTFFIALGMPYSVRLSRARTHEPGAIAICFRCKNEANIEKTKKICWKM